MTLKISVLNRILSFSSKKNNNLYKPLFPHVQLRCKTNNSFGFDSSIFDSLQIQKYLNYLLKTNKNEQIVSLLERKKEIENEIGSLERMSSEGDETLEKLIESEKEENLDNIRQLKNAILNVLFEDTREYDNRNVELKVLPGIGGEEAKLFLKELINMYISYAEYKNWAYLFLDEVQNDHILIKGEFVFEHLKCEAGVHRVQRVPETEKSGRTHTSTCNVVVLPVPKPNEIVINDKDILVEKMRSSGPGGQNVNKRETCVRIKHIPTGVTVECQSERFQYSNMKTALEKLRTILFNMEQQQHLLERNALQKEHAHSSLYSDKIRTYNFPQNRVTDHRINLSMQNLKGFLSGNKDLDIFIEKVRETQKNKNLLAYVTNILNSNEYKIFERKEQGS